MLSKQYEQKRGKVQKAKREILDVDERRYEVLRSKQIKHSDTFFLLQTVRFMIETTEKCFGALSND